jgi:hypothetical protein
MPYQACSAKSRATVRLDNADLGTCQKCNHQLIEIDQSAVLIAIGGAGKEASVSSWSCRKRTFKL